MKAVRTRMVQRRISLAVATIVVGLAAAPGAAYGVSIDLLVSGIHAVPGEDYTLMGPEAMVGAGYGEVVDGPVDVSDLHITPTLMSDWYCETLPALPDGQTYTIIATTGGLTGTPTALSDGSTVAVRRYGHGLCWPQPSTKMEIRYHDSGPVQTVTATVVDGSPVPVTYTRVSPDPWWQLQVNEPTTVTATIDVSSGTTSGTVSFAAGQPQSDGRPLECPSQHVVAAETAPAVATCQASFGTSDRWFDGGSPSPTATFTPDDADTAQPSRGRSFVGLVRGTTTASVGSDAAHTASATVTPAFVGPFVPGGSVAFSADEAPIPGCETQPLTPDGAGSASATCDLEPLGPGTRMVAAHYSGDAEFLESDAPAKQMTMTEPPAAPAPPTAAPAPPTAAPAPPTAASAAPTGAPLPVLANGRAAPASVPSVARRGHRAPRCRRRHPRARRRAHAARVHRCTAIHRRKHTRGAGGRAG